MGTSAGKSRKLPSHVAPKPSATPSTPPNEASSTASMMNCMSTRPRRAPSALRRPISRVRSVTATSMMFITPMPPTTSAKAHIKRPAAVTVPAS